LPLALHIPLDELPDRWLEVPTDRLVATSCSSVTPAVLAWADLQLRGLDQARVLDAGYEELAAELKPGRVYKRTRR
jgi:rhodanese-related sulfurtransferase